MQLHVDPYRIGLWDYSFFDPIVGLYLVYRSKAPPEFKAPARATPFLPIQDFEVIVPHDAIYIGTSPIAKGVIVPRVTPPPPRGWQDSYPHEKYARKALGIVFDALNPFS